jgi:hypothetical protein
VHHAIAKLESKKIAGRRCKTRKVGVKVDEGKEG